MSQADIALIEVIVTLGESGWLYRDAQIIVAAPVALLASGCMELTHGYPNRNTGLAMIAARSVQMATAAPEPEVR
jgi:hypothetical protein